MLREQFTPLNLRESTKQMFISICLSHVVMYCSRSFRDQALHLEDALAKKETSRGSILYPSSVLPTKFPILLSPIAHHQELMWTCLNAKNLVDLGTHMKYYLRTTFPVAPGKGAIKTSRISLGYKKGRWMGEKS